MGALEIVLLLAGGILAVLSFITPAGDEVPQETKKLAQAEIKTLAEQEMNNIRQRVDDVVGESIEYAVEKTERSLERLTNEKIMAINEYSDTVLSEIHRNHEEVMFLYDMLTDKQTGLKNMMAELNKTVQEAGERKQETEAAVDSFQKLKTATEQEGRVGLKRLSQATVALKTALEKAIAEKVAIEKAAAEEAIAEKAAMEKAAIEKAAMEKAAIEKAAMEKAAIEKAEIEKAEIEKAEIEKAAMEKSVMEKASAEQAAIEQAATEQTAVGESVAGGAVIGQPPEPAPFLPEQLVSGSVMPDAPVFEASAFETPAFETPAFDAPVFGAMSSEPPMSAMTILEMPIAGISVPESLIAEPSGQSVPEKAGESGTDLYFMAAGKENAVNNNEQILRLYEQGKSNVSIARELGLGVGEVKLVIDLYKNQ